VPLDRELRAIREELVQPLRVAPFISADESLVRCRQAADEIEALMYENAALRRDNADLRERIAALRFEARV
jgi:cell division protein FtsB